MIILASASPRRQELLRLITEDFKVVCSNADERQIEQQLKGGDIMDLPVHLARAKAREVFERTGEADTVVIGADTAVICDGRVLGKPASKDEARQMLTFLSGKSHSVVTGVCVISGSREEAFREESIVTFNPADDLQKGIIERYISSDDPYDKAGAYGIQNGGALLVQKVEGDYFNIVGLPVARLARVLYSLF